MGSLKVTCLHICERKSEASKNPLTTIETEKVNQDEGNLWANPVNKPAEKVEVNNENSEDQKEVPVQ